MIIVHQETYIEFESEDQLLKYFAESHVMRLTGFAGNTILAYTKNKMIKFDAPVKGFEIIKRCTVEVDHEGSG